MKRMCAWLHAVALTFVFPLGSACGQQPAIPVVGFLSNATQTGSMHLAEAFREGLKSAGYVEGRTVTVEYRWAERHNERLRDLTRDLIDRKVAVIAVGGGSDARIAAKRATTSIPVVFVMGGDPVQEGLVTSLNRPGANVTGVSFVNTFMEPKRLGLLHEVMPPAVPFVALVDPNIVASGEQVRDLQTAAREAGRQLRVRNVRNQREIEDAFADFRQGSQAALIVAASPFFLRQQKQLLDLAARHAVPAIYETREFAEAGGLMSYGASVADGYRQMGVYVGSILNGAKPSELPVLQSGKYEFVINLKTAKQLALKIPQSILLRADATIE